MHVDTFSPPPPKKIKIKIKIQRIFDIWTCPHRLRSLRTLTYIFRHVGSLQHLPTITRIIRSGHVKLFPHVCGSFAHLHIQHSSLFKNACDVFPVKMNHDITYWDLMLWASMGKNGANLARVHQGAIVEMFSLPTNPSLCKSPSISELL